MYKIIYSNKSSLTITNFIDSYKKWFIKLYINSWLSFEDEIINNYIELWNVFYDLIKENIINIFKRDVIFWISEKEYWLLMITIPINNFRLFIYYTENEKLKERYIEDIEFYKK